MSRGPVRTALADRETPKHHHRSLLLTKRYDMRSPLISFRTTPPLEQHLDTRRGRHRPDDADQRRRERQLSKVARRDLERYYALLRAELHRIPRLEPDEARLLVDAFRGTVIDTSMIESAAVVLHTGAADAMRLDSLDAKWQVNRDRLLAKLQQLTPGQAAALLDAIERWHANGYPIDDDAGLEQAGLLRARRSGIDGRR